MNLLLLGVQAFVMSQNLPNAESLFHAMWAYTRVSIARLNLLSG
ncbi:hypothetical protein C4K26_0066 [Pseudomonas chlororaphis]|nr:hypothetical protein C4K26_0066 [Pseudomonas chlororaphis]